MHGVKETRMEVGIVARRGQLLPYSIRRAIVRGCCVGVDRSQSDGDDGYGDDVRPWR